MTTQQAPPKRQLKIVSCTVGHSGEKNGKPYTVYEIKATQPDGEPLPPDMKLRAFTELPVGEVVEVEVEKYTSEQYGVSYTLKPQRGQTSARVNALTQRVEALEGVVKGLAERLTAAESTIVRYITPPTGPPSEPPAGVPVVAPQGSDDDIPFLWEGPLLDIGAVKGHAAR